jgi:hypothetical protein
MRSFVICSIHQIKDNEMVGTCNTHTSDENSVRVILRISSPSIYRQIQVQCLKIGHGHLHVSLYVM